MSNDALEAQGMDLKMGNGATPTEVFTSIPEITTMSGPGGSAAVKDTTSLLDTAKTKRMGLADEGQISFDINYIPSDAQHTALRAARAARTLHNFQLVFTDGPSPTTWSFSGYVTGFTLQGVQVDGTLGAKVTIEVSGAIVES